MKTLLHRGYRYRIYPNAEQIEYFIQTFGCRRKVYNAYVDALYRQLEAMKYESGYIRKKDAGEGTYLPGSERDATVQEHQEWRFLLYH